MARFSSRLRWKYATSFFGVMVSASLAFWYSANLAIRSASSLRHSSQSVLRLIISTGRRLLRNGVADEAFDARPDLRILFHPGVRSAQCFPHPGRRRHVDVAKPVAVLEISENARA